MNKLLILIGMINFTYVNNISANTISPDKVNLHIINEMNDNINLLVIKDDKNNVIMNTNIQCQKSLGSSCDVSLNKNSLAKAGDNLFFYNGNKLVAIYDNKGQIQPNIYIDASFANTGVYVINKMRTLGLVVNYNNVIKFINQNFNDVSSDRIIDALGFYYLHHLQDKMSDDKFIRELYVNINSNNSLEHQKLSLPILNSKSNNLRTYSQANYRTNGVGNFNSVASASPFCSNGFSNSMDLFDASFTLIPFMSIITNGAKTIAGFSCDDSGNGFSAEFSQINAKLDEINNKLDVISADIAKFNQEWRQDKINAYNSNLERSINQISTVLDSYYYSLAPQTKIGKTVLADFIKQKGGLANAEADPKFKTNTDELVKNSVDLVNLYKNLTVDSQNISDYLDKICSNPDTMPTEVIATRLWCNYRIIEIYSKLKFTTTAVENFYTDFNQIYPAKPGMAILTTADINKVQQQIEVFTPKKYPYTKNILEGLNVNLVNNIKQISSCTVDNMPNIERWQGKGSSKSPYIVVKCYSNKEGNSFKDLITSKYYYINSKTNSTEANVINVLGVLVPKQFFQNASDKGTFNETNWLDQSSFQSRAKNDSSIISGNYYAPISTAVNNNNGLNTASSFVPTSAGSINFSRDNKNYQASEFVPQISDIANSLNFRVSYPLAYYWGNSSANSGFSHHSFIFMRTLHEGYGYVWLNRAKLYREWQPIGDMFYYQTVMQCMTYDCRASNDPLRQLIMEHDATKPVKIGFKGTANDMTNSDSQRVGTYYTNNKLYINDKQAF
jgi:hypothetical protein